MTRFNLRTAIAAAAAGVVMMLAGASHATTDTELVADARTTVATFERTDPGLSAWFSRASGYAVFPGVGKGGLGIGGGHGSGVVFQNGQPIGKTSMTQITVGAQVGGQAFSEVIFFETPQALADFTRGNFEFHGAVSAVALKSGASADAKYKNSVAVFTATKGGMMLEAAIGGQKFKYEPFTKR
jgi:lipid-binding SYLF domain-containing protein